MLRGSLLLLIPVMIRDSDSYVRIDAGLRRARRCVQARVSVLRLSTLRGKHSETEQER